MTRVEVPYLGVPGALKALPSPNSPMGAALSSGDTPHALLSGGTAVTRRLNVKHTYSLPYSYLDEPDADLILGFYQRLYGLGPFLFVDPSVRNVLPLDQSSMGVRSQAAHGWVASGGVLTRSANAPLATPGSGSLTWGTLSGSLLLHPAVDVATSPAWVPTEFCTASMWVKATSALAASIQLRGFDAAGSPVATLSQAVTLPTGWGPISVTAGPSEATLAGSAYVVPYLVLGGSAPTSVSVAAAQVEYADARSDWQPGFGSPRVLPSAPPGRDVQQLTTSDHTFVLAEV